MLFYDRLRYWAMITVLPPQYDQSRNSRHMSIPSLYVV